MARKKQGFVYGAMILMLSNILVKIIGALFKIPLSNFIGDTSMGYFSTAYSVYSMLFLISTAGLPVAISRMIAAARAKNNAREVERIYKISLAIFLAIGFVGTCLLFFLSNQIAAIPDEPQVAVCLRTISPIMFFVCMASCFRGYFQGNQNMTPTAVSQVIEMLGNLLIGLTAGIWASRNGFAPNEVAAFVLAGVTFGVIASAVYLAFAKWVARRDEEINLDLALSVRSKKEIAKELIWIAIPITLASSILSLTSVIDSMVSVKRLKDMGVGLGYAISAGIDDATVAISIYGAYTAKAVTLFNMPTTIVHPFAVSIIPLISGAKASGDQAGLKRSMDFTFRIVSAICLPCAVGIAVLSKPILDLLFSDKLLFYTASGAAMTSNQVAGQMLTILAPAIFFFGMISVSGAMLQAYGFERMSILSTCCGVIGKLAAAYLFISLPAVGAYGIPLSTFTCYFIMFFFNMFFLVKFVDYKIPIRASLLKPLLASAVCGIFAVLLRRAFLFFVPSKISTILAILGAAMIYVITLFLIRGIDREDVLQLPKGQKLLILLQKLRLIRE